MCSAVSIILFVKIPLPPISTRTYSPLSYTTLIRSCNSTASKSGASNAADVFIRGIGQDDFFPTIDPGVGIYLDGVYVSRTLGGVLDTVDIEQVALLQSL